MEEVPIIGMKKVKIIFGNDSGNGGLVGVQQVESVQSNVNIIVASAKIIKPTAEQTSIANERRF